MADNERSPHNAHDVDPLKLCIRSGVLHGEVKHRILNVGSGCRIAKGDTLEEIHPRRTVPVCACLCLSCLETEICRESFEPRVRGIGRALQD